MLTCIMGAVHSTTISSDNDLIKFALLVLGTYEPGAVLRRTLVLAIAGFTLGAAAGTQAFGQMTANEQKAVVGDAPADPGPLATGLSGEIKPRSIRTAMRQVADWQVSRIADSPSQDWTFATLYVGMLAASDTLHDPHDRNTVASVADYYHWTLGPRKAHADDQAIGQAYLWLYRQKPTSQHIEPLRTQFDEVMQAPDDPAKPVWWWCDALFMAPPVWSGLAATTHNPKYLAYMHHEWQVTSDLLWDPQEALFFRDSSYFDKREKNGRKVFWSRGNGWVMGGLVRVLESLPANDPRRSFYVGELQAMAKSVAKLQGTDGLWRPGLLDAADYSDPEVSGSAFFVYAIAWGMNHHLLDEKEFAPVVRHGWAGLVSHIYADGRLGCIQPVGAAPGAYTASSSYVFGTGAFLLAGSEVDRWAVLQSGKAIPARKSPSR
jgi:unsaturated rhamnogalacturonyl hydrolase